MILTILCKCRIVVQSLSLRKVKVTFDTKTHEPTILRGKDMWHSLETYIKINSFSSKQSYLNWCKKNSVRNKLHILNHSINLWILPFLSGQVFFHYVWLRDLKMAATSGKQKFYKSEIPSQCKTKACFATQLKLNWMD